MAKQAEGKKKAGSGLTQRLPRFSTGLWLLILVCLFLIAMVPLGTGYMEQVSLQAGLKDKIGQIQAQIDGVKARVVGQAALAAEVARMKADTETSRSQYVSILENPEISRAITDLAWKNDITIVSMIVSDGSSKVQGNAYPTVVYTLNLKGQVAGFQNFLIALGRLYPSSQYLDITIQPAEVEGEMDAATISFQILCNPA